MATILAEVDTNGINAVHLDKIYLELFGFQFTQTREREGDCPTDLLAIGAAVDLEHHER